MGEIVMSEENKDNLLYRPELAPDRHYESDGIFKDTSGNVVSADIPTKTDIINELKDTMTQMSDLLDNGLPDIAHIARTVDKLKQRLEVAFPDGYKVPEKENVPIKPEEIDKIVEETETKTKIYTPEEAGYTPTSIFNPNDKGIEVEVVEPRSILNIAIASYARDTVDLQKYYVDSMQTVLQSYYNQMLATAAETGLADFSLFEKKVNPEKITVPSSDLRHLKDYIARSQNGRLQKASYFKKTHNVDQTMIHMRR